ncbi:hypothetical protein PJI17_06105 [Mycobacterium kansasii]
MRPTRFAGPAKHPAARDDIDPAAPGRVKDSCDGPAAQRRNSPPQSGAQQREDGKS